jgi:uracil-DNA glycosylase
LPVSRLRFRHGAIHVLPDGLKLANSYHVSRYNTSTRRLTPQMFEDVVLAIKTELAGAC